MDEATSPSDFWHERTRDLVHYDELRGLACAKLIKECPGQTLEATALVHEAYLRLFGDRARPKWSNRRHFFGAASEAMRRILIDRARKKKRVRHGGGQKRLDLDFLDIAVDETVGRITHLDKVLNCLAADDPQAAEIVNLRYFAGLTIQETAKSLGLSVRTTNRRWAYARAWLLMKLDKLEDDSMETGTKQEKRRI